MVNVIIYGHFRPLDSMCELVRGLCFELIKCWNWYNFKISCDWHTSLDVDFVTSHIEDRIWVYFEVNRLDRFQKIHKT